MESDRGAAGVGGDASSTSGDCPPNHIEIPDEYPLSRERIWNENLQVRDYHHVLEMPCVAMRTNIPVKPPVLNASGWPTNLYCDSSNLKEYRNLFQFITSPVRSGPYQGLETEHPTLLQLVNVIVHRGVAFEIECKERNCPQGILYLFRLPSPVHGHSLLGVFRPPYDFGIP